MTALFDLTLKAMLVTSWRTLICMGFVIDIHLFFVPALIKNSAILLSERLLNSIQL